LGRSRAAINAADRRLAANYLQKLKAAGHDRFKGTVSHITSSGFTVKLADSGLEGLIDLRPEAEKFSFDKWTMSLTSTTRRFQLAQAVDVTFVDAPVEGDFLSRFALVDGCGVKPPKEPKTDTGTTDGSDSEPGSDLTAEKPTETAADADPSAETLNTVGP
jgi:ribonuclease R